MATGSSRGTKIPSEHTTISETNRIKNYVKVYINNPCEDEIMRTRDKEPKMNSYIVMDLENPNTRGNSICVLSLRKSMRSVRICI